MTPKFKFKFKFKIESGCVLGCLGAFLWLAYMIAPYPVLFDARGFDIVSSLRSQQLNTAMLAITHLGDWIAIVFATGALALILMLTLVFRSAHTQKPQARDTNALYTRATFFLLMVVIGGAFLNRGLKLFFARPRPTFLSHLQEAHSPAFPSGHTMITVCFYGALIVLSDWLNWTKKSVLHVACVTMIIATGISRVYLGVHYPTDVLGAWLIGIVWLWTVKTGFHNSQKNNPTTT